MPFGFGFTDDGQPGYKITGEDGADTVIPFKSNDFEVVMNWANGSWDSKGYSNFSQSYKAKKKGTLIVYALASWWTPTPLGTPNTKCTLNGTNVSPIKKNNFTPGIISIYKLDVKENDTIVCSGLAYNVGANDYYSWALVYMIYI